jgi:hypothetical protein
VLPAPLVPPAALVLPAAAPLSLNMAIAAGTSGIVRPL